MRKAVIDMGTNTFNLLIADVNDRSFNPVFATKEPVLLGMGGINDNRIAEDAMARAHLAVKKFTRTCNAFNIERQHISAIGTSALRGASNSHDFIESMKRVFGIEVTIVSGEQEANYIYNGVKWTHDFKTAGVIMDIGGGSSEFIHATDTGILDLTSLDIGVSRVYQHFDHPKMYSPELQRAIFDYFDKIEAGKMNEFKVDTLIGASGSFETFYEMIHEKKWEVVPEIMDLPMDGLLQQIDWSIRSSQTERNDHVWITQIRKTMLPIAALQVKWALLKTGATRVVVSPYSLKEGVLR